MRFDIHWCLLSEMTIMAHLLGAQYNVLVGVICQVNEILDLSITVIISTKLVFLFEFVLLCLVFISFDHGDPK